MLTIEKQEDETLKCIIKNAEHLSSSLDTILTIQSDNLKYFQNSTRSNSEWIHNYDMKNTLW